MDEWPENEVTPVYELSNEELQDYLERQLAVADSLRSAAALLASERDAARQDATNERLLLDRACALLLRCALIVGPNLRDDINLLVQLVRSR